MPGVDPLAPASDVIAVARGLDLGGDGLRIARALADAADARTKLLLDGFVHQAGPPPGRFTWVVLGSHARRELHCASDQDHALVWADARSAASGYAADLADAVIEGLEAFGMRRCDGGYMADRWSHGVDDWVDLLRDRIAAPTPDAVVDADIFLDFRALGGDVPITRAKAVLLAGADSARLMHGLAHAANGFPVPLNAFGRLPRGKVDLKRTGLAPIVLLARLYGLLSRSGETSTLARLRAAADADVLGEDLSARLQSAFLLLTRLRLARQVTQVAAGKRLTDQVKIKELPEDDQALLRDGFRAIKSAQATTAVRFRTDL